MTGFLLAALCASLAAWLAASLRERGFHPLRRAAAACRRPAAELALLALVAVGFIHHGATKVTNRAAAPPAGTFAPMAAPDSAQSAPADSGHVLAVTNADWLAFGGFEDWFHIEPGGWCFRFGTGLVERVTVFASGEIRAAPRDMSNRLSVLGLPLSIVPAANWRLVPQPLNPSTPQHSLFWHAETPSNTLVLTWENALVNRDTNWPVTVQAELFPDGAAALRYGFLGLADAAILSNAAVRIWRDGVLSANAITDGGQGSPALPETLEVGFSAPQITGTNALAEVHARIAGGDSNAYYFADAVVPKGPARIEVSGEGESTLGGYAIMAEAGVTNRLPFLIGPRYTVSSEVAFSHFALAPSALETPESRPVTTNLTDRLAEVCWPVAFALEEIASDADGAAYTVRVSPEGLEGMVRWDGDTGEPMRGAPLLRSGGGGCACGCQSFSTNSVHHASSCPCADCTVSGGYAYEGHVERFSLKFPDDGGGGGEPPEPDPDTPDPDDPPEPASVSVSFEKPVVIFEDRYETSPGVFVERRSTKTKLTVSAYGGPNGCLLSLNVSDDLARCPGAGSFPGFVGPESSVEWHADYEGVSASAGQDAAAATVMVTDFASMQPFDAIANATVVEVKRTAVATTPAARSRTDLGAGEVVDVEIHPISPLEIVSADVGTLSPKNQQGHWLYLAPHQACADTLTVAMIDENHTVNLSIIEPTGFIVKSIQGFANAIENVAGGFSAEINYIPSPTNVSFYALEFLEIGMTAEDAAGYFTNSIYASWLDHSQNGAGCWVHLNTFDDEFIDTVVMPTLPQPWNDGGGFTWPVPVAWRFYEEAGVTNIVCNHDQRFELDANGTSRIQKMGCLVERATNNFFRATREN